MSTDTVALLEVPDARAALQSIFDSATTTKPDPLCAVEERYSEQWRIKEWKYDQPDNLLGPGGFSIRAKGRIVEVYHLLRYSTFTMQGEDGILVMNALQFICHLIGSDKMIIMHELLPWEGADLRAITENVRKKIGPPAKDWKELSTSNLYEPGCWIIISHKHETQ